MDSGRLKQYGENARGTKKWWEGFISRDDSREGLIISLGSRRDFKGVGKEV